MAPPMCPLDAVYPTSRLEAMLEDSRAKCVIGNAALTSTRIPSMPALHLETVSFRRRGARIVRRLISNRTVVRQGSRPNPTWQGRFGLLPLHVWLYG